MNAFSLPYIFAINKLLRLIYKVFEYFKAPPNKLSIIKKAYQEADCKTFEDGGRGWGDFETKYYEQIFLKEKYIKKL